MLDSLVRSLVFPLVALAGSVQALAHNQVPGWLEEHALERGLYVEVRHPGVLRKPQPFRVSVIVTNVDGSGPATVVSVRYLDPARPAPIVRSVDRELSSKSTWFDEYHAVTERLSEMSDIASPERLDLLRRRMVLMGQIASDAWSDAYTVDPEVVEDADVYELTVEVDVAQDQSVRTVRRDVSIPIESPLPDGSPSGTARRFDLLTGETTTADIAGAAAVSELWYAGDQHLHTRYSIDAYFGSGNRSNVADYAAVAEAAGLDWIVVTDHSNIDFGLLGNHWYTPEQYAAGTAEAAQYRTQTGFLVFNGQEMGAGSGDPAHVLAYPFVVDSTGFLPNPCTGGLFGHADCEPEQIILDRINGSGGIGFIAHPFQSSSGFFRPWNFENGVTGWAGFEIFNSNDGKLTDADRRALLKWFELLNAVETPAGGDLAPRDDYPTKFPVGLGNSDAHEPGLIGKTFTYCQSPAESREAIMGSLAEGRCVASNGPLAYMSINGAGPGQVATLLPGENTLTVTIQSTPEFGPAGAYTVFLFVNGVQAATLPPNGSPEPTSTTVFENVGLGGDFKYIVLAAVAPSGRLAIANPVWISPP